MTFAIQVLIWFALILLGGLAIGVIAVVVFIGLISRGIEE